MPDSASPSCTLAELCISACSEAWRDDGEVLATGIGLVPRLAAGLAMLSCNPALMMTDGEAYLVSEPVPVGPRNGYQPKVEGWMPYSRVFDNLWGGRRHAMVMPTQIDQWGQSNISCIGGDFQRPKVQLLGVRGFPGNTANHPNSMFVNAHSPRVLVEGEVDMVSGVGYRSQDLPEGARMDFLDLRLIVTNLCVLDFSGPEHRIALRSLHPGISTEQVTEQTGFELHLPARVATTPLPSAEQLALIQRLDPHDLRANVFPGNPPAVATGDH